ncbi:hypothetical protein AGMMS50249_7360 [candidate division SR1 bacterium]|nr:hypothetical protein AGMMS50249_7360 [candidate division SR1 bacterium]
MTENNITPEKAQANNQVRKSLEQGIMDLIQHDTTNLSDLSNFKKHLSGDIKITVSHQMLENLKADLENGDLVVFEGGVRNEKRFGFESIGRDIKPTITPSGDVLIPVNFWYDSQRRTKILVLHLMEEDGKLAYQLPNGNNSYDITIGHEDFTYELYHQDNLFYLKIKE